MATNRQDTLDPALLRPGRFAHDLAWVCEQLWWMGRTIQILIVHFEQIGPKDWVPAARQKTEASHLLHHYRQDESLRWGECGNNFEHEVLEYSCMLMRWSSLHQVDLEDYVARPDRISGADINAICQEAGMHAVRENRYFALPILASEITCTWKFLVYFDFNIFHT